MVIVINEAPLRAALLLRMIVRMRQSLHKIAEYDQGEGCGHVLFRKMVSTMPNDMLATKW